MFHFKLQFYYSLFFSVILCILFGTKPLIAASQIVSLEPGSYNCSIYDQIQLEAIYKTSDDGKAYGVGVRFHYNSNTLNFVEFNMIFQLPPPIFVTTPSDDYDNFDEDSDTDKYVLLTWFDMSKNFPLTTMPFTLTTLLFTGISAGATSVNVSYSYVSEGYTGKSSSAHITLNDSGFSYISGHLFPCNDDLILSTDIYTLSYGQIYGHAKLLPECYFFMSHEPGTFILEVKADGYHQHLQNLKVPEMQTVDVEIYLQKIVSKVDLKNVIQLMKYLSRQ